MKNLSARGHYNNSSMNIQVQLHIIMFYEEETYFVYAPALDLVGYGDTEDEAKESFDVVLKEYLDYTTKKDTIFIDLQRLGWQVKRAKKSRPKVSPPSYEDLVVNNEKLKNLVIGMRDMSIRSRNVSIPV
ncbi:MAG: hypothetical protein JJU02_15470 [Cryomorphaceae bacterium]|nr:hypothetical protein [Cryomorphaceae bacterium]